MLHTSDGSGRNEEADTWRILKDQLNLRVVTNRFDVSLTKTDKLNNETYADDVHSEETDNKKEVVSARWVRHRVDLRGLEGKRREGR